MRTRQLLTITIAILLAIFFASASVAAQGRMSRRAAGSQDADRVEKLKKWLDLTPEQETKIRAIFEESGEKLQAVRAKQQSSEPPSREEMEKEITALRSETSSKVKEVLTEEQQAKLEKLQEKAKSRRQHSGRRSRG